MFDLAFNSLDEILQMNGHGIYVWSVYVVGITAILVSFIIAKKRLRETQEKIRVANASS
mgnify:CR=1 FL=1|tara:strand:+ start:303 stop:479 length:177 start_codon:yes stop_codon:yes gene_type:complete